MWKNLDKARTEIVDYSVLKKKSDVDGMAALRRMFPEAKADSMNFVLFSTGGVHGSYITIEDAELFLKGETPEQLLKSDDIEGCGRVTFLIVHPRWVTLRYGECEPKNEVDIDYLKQLRSSSQEAVAGIGALMPTSGSKSPQLSATTQSATHDLKL